MRFKSEHGSVVDACCSVEIHRALRKDVRVEELGSCGGWVLELLCLCRSENLLRGRTELGGRDRFFCDLTGRALVNTSAMYIPTSLYLCNNASLL